MAIATASALPSPLIFRKQDEPSPLSPEQEEILRLKKERNAVILCHNYQVEPIQQIADYVGDSLGLAYKAAETDAEVIVFCGVHFMAETAKILNPGKTVLLPDIDAGCSLSDSCPAEKLATFREENPNENTTMALISFRDGTSCTYWSSSVLPDPGFPQESFRFRFMGDEGIIDHDPYSRVQLGKAGEWTTVYEQPPGGHTDR